MSDLEMRVNIAKNLVDPVITVFAVNYNILQIEGGIQPAFLIEGYYNNLNGKMTSESNPFISYDIGLMIGIDYKYSQNKYHYTE